MVRMIYRKDADAVYICLREDGTITRTRNLDGSRLVDYAQDGEPVGIELLDVSEGVNLDSLPTRETVARLLAEHRIEMNA